MIEIVPARFAHIEEIEPRMRDIDRLECRIMGHSPREALKLGIMSATVAWTALVDGRAEAMFGASTISLIDGSGRPWMLMTDEAVQHKKALLRFGRIYTEALHRHYAILQNWVHARNSTSIRWLARLGYGIGPVEIMRGEPMRPFVRCAILSR